MIRLAKKTYFVWLYIKEELKDRSNEGANSTLLEEKTTKTALKSGNVPLT